MSVNPRPRTSDPQGNDSVDAENALKIEMRGRMPLVFEPRRHGRFG